MTRFHYESPVERVACMHGCLTAGWAGVEAQMASAPTLESIHALFTTFGMVVKIMMFEKQQNSLQVRRALGTGGAALRCVRWRRGSLTRLWQRLGGRMPAPVLCSSLPLCSCLVCEPWRLVVLQALVQMATPKQAADAKSTLDGRVLPSYLAPNHPVEIRLKVGRSLLLHTLPRVAEARARKGVTRHRMIMDGYDAGPRV